MMQELRCTGNKLHGVACDEWIEFRCSSVFCGYKPGIVVMHRWYFGELEKGPETRIFKDPGRKQ